MNPDRLAERGDKSAGQDILCKFLTYLHFYDVLFRFYHVRGLNIHKFGHGFYFWDKKKCWCTLTSVLFASSIFTSFTGHFIMRLIAHRSASA